MIRAHAGRAGAAIAADRDTAHARLSTVVGLLPILTSRALTAQDRQHHLSQMQCLGADTARAAVALEFSGQTRQRC
jgi:hypothetical protein